MSEPPKGSDARAALRKILADEATVSGQIRALARLGWSRAEIARALGKRYQHVRNVLEDDKRRTPAATSSGPGFAETTAPYQAGAIDLDRALDALSRARRQPGDKRPVTVAIDANILAAAEALGLELSAEFERALMALARQRAAELWQAENREAIEERNRFIERHGLWSDGLRQF